MPTVAFAPQVFQLTKKKRLELAERLWLSVADESSMAVPESHKRILRKRRAAQELRPGEILLDVADRLDHLTVFDCLLFPMVKKAAISAVIGHVSTERKRHLHRTPVAALRLFT
jgi:hypothetical protein